MTSYRIAAISLITLLAAAPAYADGEPRTVENMFPGWTSAETGLPSEHGGGTGLRVRDYAIEDRYQTGDQLALAPEWAEHPSPRGAFATLGGDNTGPYSRN